MTGVITLNTTAGTVRLRPEQASDSDFLFGLFRSHVLRELAIMPVDDATRAASTALLDSMPDRGAWEISTFGFTTDEPTAWALATASQTCSM